LATASAQVCVPLGHSSLIFHVLFLVRGTYRLLASQHLNLRRAYSTLKAKAVQTLYVRS